MWTAILSFLAAALPGLFGTAVNGVVQIEQAKIAAVNTTENTEAGIVASDNATRAAIMPAMLSHWPTQIPIFCLMMLPVFYGAAVEFDAIFQTHSTDAIHGDVAAWMNTIIESAFGYGKVVVASMAASVVSKAIFGK